MKRLRNPLLGLPLLATLTLGGCATSHLGTIAWGTAGGAALGAVVGHEFIHHGQYNQYETRNTIITSVVFAVATAGLLYAHYQALQEREVEISAKYSRYRLCNPDEKILNFDQGSAVDQGAFHLQPEQIGKFTINLDDNNKWVLPTFRKRLLPPERDESSALSSRYLWEILRPGSFVTRSQDPQYFAEPTSQEKK